MGESGQPLVSVIMNGFNGEKYLRQAVDSVMAQSYRNWELVFWDNQSTDRSAEIVRSYDDPRVRYHRAPSHTLLYEARNYAIDRSRGDLIAFLDVDDWWLPEKLDRQVPLFDEPAVGFAYGRFWIFNERRGTRRVFPAGPAPAGRVTNDLLRLNFIGLLTLVVRRKALQSLAYACDPEFHIIGDFDLAVRLSVDWTSACVQEPVAVSRAHGGNETGKHGARHVNELEFWARRMKAVDAIQACPNAAYFDTFVVYRRGLHGVLQGDRRLAFDAFRALPWGPLKLKLLVLLGLPSGLARRLRD